MRYRELFEQRNDTWQRVPIDLYRVQTKIRTECKQAWAAHKQGHTALRGVANATEEFYWGVTGSDRKPKDSLPGLQSLVDQALRDHLGADAAVRSNSIFVTGDIGVAEVYGDKLFAVFPTDSAKFTWSKLHSDLVLNSWSVRNWFTYEPLSSLPSYQKFLELVQATGSKKIKTPPYIVTVGQMVLSDHDEFNRFRLLATQLLDSSPTFQAAAAQSGLSDDLKALRGSMEPSRIARLINMGLAHFDADKFVANFQPQTGDWLSAVQSHKEIYVSGEYVLVNLDVLDQL